MNAVEVITELPAEARALLLDIEMLDAESHALAIADEAQCKLWVAETLPRVKAMFNALEAKRTTLKRPILDAGNQIDALFRPTLDLLAEVERRIKNAFKEFRRHQAAEALRVAAERQREEEARRAETVLAIASQLETQGRLEEATELMSRAVDTPLPPVSAPAVRIKDVTARKIYKWNVANLSQVPDEYKIVDSKKVEARVRTFGLEAGIPGIEVYEDEEIAVRSAKVR